MATVKGEYTITVNPAPPPPLTLNPPSGALPDATVGSAYSSGVAASGGVPPYSYAVTSGALPAGLALGSSDGSITGTPTAAGSSSFEITATDSTGATVTGKYTINVQPVQNPLVLTPAGGALPGGQVGVAYSSGVVASGGAAPYTYALTNGALVPGLVLGASDGTITGTPTTAGAANFEITATDALGAKAKLQANVTSN